MKVYTYPLDLRLPDFYVQVYIGNNALTVAYFRALSPEQIVNNASIVGEMTKEEYETLISEFSTNNLQKYVTYKIVSNEIVQKADVDSSYYFLFVGVETLKYSEMSKRDCAIYTNGINETISTVHAFFPRYAYSYNSKSRGPHVCKELRCFPMVELLCPSSALELTNSNNWLMVAHAKTITADIFNISNTEITVEEMSDMNIAFAKFKQFRPTARISGDEEIGVDECKEYTVEIRRLLETDHPMIPTGELFNVPLTIEIENYAGYVPVRKFYVTDGKCKFTLCADRVPSGTVIDVKINCGTYTRIGSKEIVVV